MAKKICINCQRNMQDTNFYTYRNGEKTQMCKACMTMHVDNFDPDTFLWLLEKMDVPYLPWQWNTIRDKAYAKNPQKMNGMSVFGKYLSKMKLKQWKDARWADTEALQAEHEKLLAQQNELSESFDRHVRQQYQNGDISEAQYRTLVSTQFQKANDQPGKYYDPVGADNMFNEKNFLSEDDLPDLGSQLTLEDKQYLAMKWGRTYKVAEWVDLEKTYTEMMNSFDIQDADSKNTLIFICKTYLKMNQAIDCGDVQGYQKLSKVYNDLRKTMKVTAAQNKEEKSEFIDSVGQLVAYCQKYGGQIPRYEITAPQDIIDKVIMDLKDYNKSLFYGDTALARQIEDYIKQARAVYASKKDREEAKAKGLEVPELSDQDIMDFRDFVQQEKDDEAGDEE